MDFICRLNKRQDRDGLLQGTELMESSSTAGEPLPQAQSLPKQHQQRKHDALSFVEPENREGECVKLPRRRNTPWTTTPVSNIDEPKGSADPPAMPTVSSWPRLPPYPDWYGWPLFPMPQTATQPSVNQQPYPFIWPLLPGNHPIPVHLQVLLPINLLLQFHLAKHQLHFIRVNVFSQA